MGSSQSTPQDSDDMKYFRGSVATNLDLDEISVIVSYCKQVGIGKYMKANSNKKVQHIWDRLIRQTDIISKTSDMKLDDRLLLNQVQQKYRFVLTGQDLTLLMLFIMDQKGVTHVMRLGVPNLLRWSAWKTIILLKNPGLVAPLSFEKMINLESPDLSTIEKDVMRTLMSHHFFQETSMGYGQQQLMRVLVGVSNYMPKLGYCQGMNFLVGFLLMVSGCDESLTYSCMLSLLTDSRFLLYFFYCDGLPLFVFVQFMAGKLIERYLPELSKHLVDSETPESFWLTKILLSVFLYVFKISDCTRLWDYFLARGSVQGYLELILGVTFLVQAQMLKADNLEISNLFAGNKKIKLEFDVDQAIYHAQTTYRIKRVEISKLAKEFMKDQKPGCFASIFTLFHDKKLFMQALAPWVQGIN